MQVAIVGAGIMGVTLGVMIKKLAPELKILLIERLPESAGSNTWVFHNAGTGHEANCELNYTPVDEEEISVEKALKIHAQFNVAKQFWAYLVREGIIEDPTSFINPTKHCTLVNEDAIPELKLRFEEMTKHHFFDNMQYSEEHELIKSWIPLTMDERPSVDRVAATMIETGTDVNFESVTKQMATWLRSQPGVETYFDMHVKHAHRAPSGRWQLETETKGLTEHFKSDILFVGAGGGAFPILKHSKLPSRRRFAGFPVGGRFLMAQIDEETAKRYDAKTYGKAKVGAPPMSVPHLDLRVANGRHYLLFGPFATFMPRLEKGRGILEYLFSIKLHDIPNLLRVARDHFPLMKYLIEETFKGKQSMLKELDDFAPGLSKKFKWEAVDAGQRVQIIKDGDLQMGTEVVVSEDNTYGTILGASPGASVSPEIMLQCFKKVVPHALESEESQKVFKEMFDETDLEKLMHDAELYRSARDKANKTLGIV